MSMHNIPQVIKDTIYNQISLVKLSIKCLYFSNLKRLKQFI
jgi:hypothetical protein